MLPSILAFFGNRFIQARAVIDLPEPLSPTSANVSFSLSEKDKFLTTFLFS